MKLSDCIPVVVILTAAILLGAERANAEAPNAPLTVMPSKPFWQDKTMTDEPVFFITKDGATSASLLFTPTKILRVTYWDGDKRVTLRQGQDFTWSRKSDVLTLTPGAGAPSKTWEQMRPAMGSPMSIGAAVDGQSALFWSEGRVFHDLQVMVTYEHRGTWTPPAPPPSAGDLKGTIAQLKTRKPFKLVALGDSITAGYNASGFVGAPPMQPPYAALVANTLGERSGAPVMLTNLAVAGKRSDWGVEMVPKVLEEHPDLVILAFGMNDGSGRVTSEAYAANIKAIMDGVRAGIPNCSFVLVAPMTGNPEWTGAATDLYPKYRDALAGLTGSGVALADVTSIWTSILTHKKFTDLTGNGVNHPNDFGHRIYAATILSLFPAGR